MTTRAPTTSSPAPQPRPTSTPTLRRPETYRVTRMYRDHSDRRVIARGLTLDAAKAWCQHPETSSSTATSPEAIEHTRQHGPWFDGFEREDEPRRATARAIQAARLGTDAEYAAWTGLAHQHEHVDELAIALRTSLALHVALDLDDELALVDWHEVALAAIEDASA